MKRECYRNNNKLKGNISIPIVLEETTRITKGDDIIESVSLFDNKLFVSVETYVVCFDINSKKILWEKEIASESYAPVAMDNGKIYAYIEDRLSCLDVNNGDILWQGEDEDYLLGASENYLYCREPNTVICRSKENGDEVWRSNIHSSFNWLAADDDLVVLQGVDGFHVCEESTGNVLWAAKTDEWLKHYFPNKTYGSDILGPLIDGIFYVGFEGGLLAAISAKNGEMLWGYELKQPDRPNTMIYDNGKIYFNIDQGWVTRNYLTCVDAKTGELITQTEENFSPFGCRGLLSVGKYILGGMGQYLSFFDTEKQEFVYQYKHKKKVNMFGNIMFAFDDQLVSYNNDSKEIFWFRSVPPK